MDAWNNHVIMTNSQDYTIQAFRWVGNSIFVVALRNQNQLQDSWCKCKIEFKDWGTDE